MNTNVRELIESTVQPILSSLGVELVEIEYNVFKNRGQLKIFIDKEGGVALEDCEKASKYISHALDVSDVVPVTYNLEVSSPGIDRVLKSIKEYIKYKGKIITIKIKEPIDGRAFFKSMTIKDVKNSNIIEVISGEGDIINISFDNIIKAKLEY